MLPAPKVGTTPVEEAESPAIFWLTGMKDQIEASEAQAEENFISLLLRIGSDRDVNRVNFEIHKQEVFAPKFLATLGPQSDPHEVAISVLTHTAALAHLEGITVFKQREVETQRAKMTEEAERWHVEAERLDLEAEQARAMGEGEFAAKAEAKARRAESHRGPLGNAVADHDGGQRRVRRPLSQRRSTTQRPSGARRVPHAAFANGNDLRQIGARYRRRLCDCSHG